MNKPEKLSRRRLLAGQIRSHHIASAVVSVLPAHRDVVIRYISSMFGVEIHHQSPSKLVLVLDGPDSGVIGSKLIEIGRVEGVLSANFVFEHVEQGSEPGERT